MPRTSTFSVRCTPEEKARWQNAAGDEKFNSWVKRSLNDASELEEALAREKREAQRERQQTFEDAFPQKRAEPDCPKWPEYCYKHAMKHV